MTAVELRSHLAHFAILFAICLHALPALANEPVVLQLPWVHQATSGGFYVADQKGFYTAEKIAIRFLEGGPRADPIASVLEGRAQFGVAVAPELVVARAQGKPVRAIATVFRRSPMVFVSKGDSGITSPEHFAGRTIRLTAVDSISFYAMMKNVGISADQYRVVNIPSDVGRFMAGEADVWTFYVNGLVIALEEAGIKLNYIYPDDYGVHFYGDTIFTTDDMTVSNPDLILRFLRASLKGWRLAVEDPNLVGPMVRLYGPKADAAVETAKMKASQALVNTGEDQIGWMKEERWSQMAAILQEQGIISAPVSANDIFTMRFLREIMKASP